MKRCLNKMAGVIFLASLFMMTSCVHQYPQPTEAEFVLDLIFDEGIPQGPVHDLTTKVSGNKDHYDIRYVVEAYRELSKGVYSEDPYAEFVFTKDDVSEFDHSLSLWIMEGSYRFSIWADYVDAGSDDNKFYNADDHGYIKLLGKEENLPHYGNTDFRDAFFGTVDAEVVRYGRDHSPSSATLEMQRPMSKVVFIATDLDLWKTKVFLNMKEMNAQAGIQDNTVKSPDDINLDDYVVTIHYPQYMPSAFSIATDRTVWSETNVSFNSRLRQLNADEASMGFDYVFANADDAKVIMSVSLSDIDGNVISRSNDITVPLERGKVTTVRGTFLTDDADGGVSIDPDFDGEFNIMI